MINNIKTTIKSDKQYLIKYYKMTFRSFHKLREWIDEQKLDFSVLSKNHNAVTLLLQNIDKIDSAEFSFNTNPIAVNMLSCAFHRINWTNLSQNPAAAHVLLKNPNRVNTFALHFNPNREILDILEEKSDSINWFWLCKNPDAMHIILQHMDRIDFDALSENKNAMDILEQYIYKVNWRNLSANPSALPILLNNPDKIDYNMFSINPKALDYLEKNVHKINWFQLLNNPNIKNYLHIIESNLDKITQLNLWRTLCQIPEAIGIIERNLEHVDWDVLSSNPSAMHLLEQNQDKINYVMLSKNPAIFVLDKDAMRQQIRDFGKRKKNNEDFGFAEELIAAALHPRHFTRNLIQYNYDIAIQEYL